MWTREIKNLKEDFGIYWYCREFTIHDVEDGREIKGYAEMPIDVFIRNHNHIETMQIGDECGGPALDTESMKRDDAWIWDTPIKVPPFP